MKVVCDNCNWDGEDNATGFIPLGECCNLAERLDSGNEVPAGECPKCGSFCYRSGKYTSVKQSVRVIDLEKELRRIKRICAKYVKAKAGKKLPDPADLLKEVYDDCVVTLRLRTLHPLVVVCEVEGGVLNWTHVSDPGITCYTLDHDEIDAGVAHDIPDDAFIAVYLDPSHYRQDAIDDDTPEDDESCDTA